MKRVEQYRKNAADALMLARASMTQSSRDYWVTMADFWFQFAQHVEESESAGSVRQMRSTGRNVIVNPASETK